ncbi:MAG: cell wall-binding repeat-containing protein [Gracilibacteraceae bacterium]|nr:cell wall-binding repeat-containing protein [Gracilibacteraceae bacterium]
MAEHLAAGYYSVPIQLYRVVAPQALQASQRIQFNERALVYSDGAGEYTITLQYNSYSVIDFISIVDPDCHSAIKDSYGSAYTDLAKLKPGTLDCPADLLVELTDKGTIDAINNEYYLSGVQREIDDETMDTGLLTFSLSSKPTEVWTRAYSDAITAAGYSFVDQSIVFNTDVAISLPDGSLDEGFYEMSCFWTNPNIYTGTGTDNTATRVNSAYTVPDFLAGAEVAVDDAGKLKAVFKLKESDDEFTLQKASGRKLASEANPRYYLNEQMGAAWANVEIIDASTFELDMDYTDLIFGVYLKLHTKTLYNNKDVSQTANAWLHLSYVPISAEVKQTESGVALRYLSTAIPASADFSAEQYSEYDPALPNMRPGDFAAMAALSGSDTDRYRVYALGLLNTAGHTFAPVNDVTVCFPIPAEWDTNKIRIHRWLTADKEINYNVPFTVSEDGLFAEVSTKDIKALNASYFIGEMVPGIRTDNLPSGLYRVSVAIMNDHEDQPSMGNTAIENEWGYIETVAGQTPLLYLQNRSVYVGETLQGYLSEIYHDNVPAEHLSYFTDEEIIANDVDGVSQNIHENYNIEFPKRIILPLASPSARDEYRILMDIPIMEFGSRYARLVVTSATLFDGENPLAGYDKNVLAAALKEARRALETVALEKVMDLRAAISAAQTQYNKTGLDSDGIQTAKTALREAIALARETETDIDDSDWPVIYGPGVYKGVGRGYAGNGSAAIEINVEVSDRRILGITAGTHAQTPGYFAMAFTNGGTGVVSGQTAASVPAQIMTAQAAGGVSLEDVDAITGATLASNGIKEAVAAALAEAEAARPAADEAALEAAVAAAEAIEGTGYIASSYTALTAAVEAAKAALLAGGLSAEQITAQIAALEAAQTALAAEDDLLVGLIDGEYSLANKTELWHYTQNQYSMGNNAIDHAQSKLVVENGKVELRLIFQPLTFLGQQGSLKEFSKMENVVKDDGGILVTYKLVPAEVYSHYDTKDSFNTGEDWLYPKELGIEVTPGVEWTDVYVNVPIMGASANQPARLWIDWSGIDLDGEAPDASALDAAITAAGNVSANASAYSPESYAALLAGVRAGQTLKTLEGVTQTMIDTRTAAILAAIEALLPAVAPPQPPDEAPTSVPIEVAPKDIITGDNGAPAAAVTVDEDFVTDAVQEAVGNNTTTLEISVNLPDTLPEGVTAVDAVYVALPPAALDVLLEELEKEDSALETITITSPVGSISFDRETLGTARAQAGAGKDVNVVISKPAQAQEQAELDALPESAKGAQVFDLSVYYVEGDTKEQIRNFGGNLTISLPYALPDSIDPARVTITVWYDSEPMPGAVDYNSDTSRVTFYTNHLSYYAVGYVEKAVTPDPPVGKPSPNGGGGLATTAIPEAAAPITVSKASLSYISGADRVQTSVAISRQGWTSAEAVILAPGGQNNLIDALAVAPLAGQEKAPILLSTGTLDPAVVAEIQRLGAKKVYAVGAISQDVIGALQAALPGLTVETLRGASRFETAELVGAKLTAPKGTFIVGYNAIADAVSAASFAAANGYAIQIASPDGSVSGAPTGEVYILGGPTLVRDVAGATRLYGATRYETNKAVRDALNFEYTNIYTADGNTLVDALTGSALAAQTKAAIVLLPGNDPAGADFGAITPETKLYAFGG